MGSVISQLVGYAHETQLNDLRQRAEWLRSTAADPNLDEATRTYAASELNKLGAKVESHKEKKQKLLETANAHQSILNQYLQGSGNIPEPLAAEAHGALTKMLPEHVRPSFQHFGENALPSMGAAPPEAPPTPQLSMQPGSAANPSVQATQQPASQPPQAPQPQQQMAPPPQAAQPSPVTASTITQPNQSATASMPPSQVGSAPSAGFAIPNQPRQMQAPPSAGFRFHPFTPEEHGQRAAAQALPALLQKNLAERAQTDYYKQEAIQLGLTDPVQIANYAQQKALTFAPMTNLRPGGKAVDRFGKVVATGGPQFVTTPAGAITTQVDTQTGNGLEPPPGSGDVNPTSKILAEAPPLYTPTQRAAIDQWSAKHGTSPKEFDKSNLGQAEAEYKEASRSKTEVQQAEDAHARTESQLKTQASARLTAEVNRKLAQGRLAQMDVLAQYDDDAFNVMAAQVRAGQKVVYPNGIGGNLVKAEVMNRVAEQAKRDGNSAAEVPAITASIKADSQALGQLEKQTTMIESFANNTDRNFQLALKMGDRVERGQSPVVNRWLLKLKGQYAGDPNVTAFEAALNTAATDWAKVTTGQTSGQAVTDSARTKYDQMVSSALSGKSLRNLYTEVVMPELDNRKQSLNGERQKLIARISGKAPMSAPPVADSGAVREQHSPSTGQYRHSMDGGKTWQPGRAPSQ